MSLVLEKFREVRHNIERDFYGARPLFLLMRSELHIHLLREIQTTYYASTVSPHGRQVFMDVELLSQERNQSVSFFAIKHGEVFIPVAYFDDVPYIVKFLEFHDYGNIPVYAIDLTGKASSKEILIPKVDKSSITDFSKPISIKELKL